MKTKTTKRSLLVSGLVLLLCVSMLVGSTFAWFTDSVTSKNNIIKSGNLDIELEYGIFDEDGELVWKGVGENTPLFSENSLWEPGHTEYALLRVKNVGTLALKYVLKAEIIEEKQGTNVYNQIFNLSDYLMYGVVNEENVDAATADREAAVAEAVHELTTSMDVTGVLAGNLEDMDVSAEKGLLPGESAVAGLIITMPTTVGNEANYKTGTEAPYIKFGVNLYATQLMHEYDSFGNDYDKDATVQGGSVTVDPPINSYETYEIRGNVEGNANGKIATMDIHPDSVEDSTKPITITVVPTTLNENVKVEADQMAKTYDISVTNLKANNDQKAIKVSLQIGKNLSGVEIYHNEELLENSYDAATGIVYFETYSFSPYTVVYDAEFVEDAVPENPPADMPQATVTYAAEYVNTDLPWGSYGQWSPTAGLDSVLEAAYVFECQDTPEQAAASEYSNWYCDFFVKLDRDLGENQIFLGGNYDGFGWVGFHNGDVTLKAGEEIPLLGSVAGNGWTYEAIADFVKTFVCGVGDVDDALSGATFTVTLRMTNNLDETESYDVAVINYTFE